MHEGRAQLVARANRTAPDTTPRQCARRSREVHRDQGSAQTCADLVE